MGKQYLIKQQQQLLSDVWTWLCCLVREVSDSGLGSESVGAALPGPGTSTCLFASSYRHSLLVTELGREGGDGNLSMKSLSSSSHIA